MAKAEWLIRADGRLAEREISHIRISARENRILTVGNPTDLLFKIAVAGRAIAFVMAPFQSEGNSSPCLLIATVREFTRTFNQLRESRFEQSYTGLNHVCKSQEKVAL